MNNIEKRLGILIGILRKKKLKAGNPAFKQESFIISTQLFKFEGVTINHRVCSLATLSRLENGKHQHDYELLDFFLKKLDIEYRIKESVHSEESEYLNKLSKSFTEGTTDQLKNLIIKFNKFCLTNSNDALIDNDYQCFQFISSCLSNQPISRKTYDHLLDQIEVFHPIIKEFFISCAYLLKLTHPDFWSIEKPKHLTDLIKRCRIELLLIKSGEQTFHPKSSRKDAIGVNSLAYKYLQEIILFDYLDHHPKGIYAKEYNLCIQLATQETIDGKGFSLLFNVLEYFNGIQDQEVQLDYFTDKISDLLRCEPHPQRITKLMGQRILLLCQKTKTYKPLVNVVDLLSENKMEKLALIKRYD